MPSLPSLSVWLPAVGALLSVLARGSRVARAAPAFAAASCVLAASVWCGLDSAAGSVSELRSFWPSLGISYSVSLDRFRALLVGWISVTSFAALVANVRNDASGRTTPRVLLLTAMVNGVLVSEDAFWLTSFLGGTVVATSLLANASRGVVYFQVAVFTILTGWIAWISRLVYEQTGFVSMDLSRWQALVLFPDEARSLLLFAGAGVVLLWPLFGRAIDAVSHAGRLVLVTSASILPAFLMMRLVIPVASAGVEASTGWAFAVALLLMLYGAPGRSVGRLVIAYQALIVLGLFSLSADGTSAAAVLMLSASVGWSGVVGPAPRAATWWFAVFLVAIPLTTLLSPLARTSLLWLGVAVVALLLVGVRLGAQVVSKDPTMSNVRGLAALPALVLSVSLLLGVSLGSERMLDALSSDGSSTTEGP